MKVATVGFLICCISLLASSVECRPTKKSCVVMRLRWHGIKCLEDIDKNHQNELNKVLNLYKTKLTDVLKNMRKGKDPIHPEVRKTLLKALQKARQRYWSAK